MEENKNDAMVRIPRKLHTKIKQLAEEDKRTFIATIEVAIDEYIESKQTHQK